MQHSAVVARAAAATTEHRRPAEPVMSRRLTLGWVTMQKVFSRIIAVAYQNRQFLLAALMPHFTLYLLCANLNVEIGYG